MEEQNVWKKVAFWRLCIGIIMIIVGFAVWMNPIASLIALAIYAGIAFIIAGVGYIVSSFSFQSGWELLVGLLDVFVGIILVSNLGVTIVSLPIIFALWCLAVGIIQMVTSFKIKKIGLPWGWSFLMGLLGIIFSFMILGHPIVGALTITTVIGLYIVVYGAISVAEYFSLPKE